MKLLQTAKFDWLMYFTQMFPIYVNVYANFHEAFLICPDIIQAVETYPNDPYLPNVFNFTQNLNDIFLIGSNLMKTVGIPKWLWLEFQMILEVTILPSGSVYFATRGNKEWQNSLNKVFAID